MFIKHLILFINLTIKIAIIRLIILLNFIKGWMILIYFRLIILFLILLIYKNNYNNDYKYKFKYIIVKLDN